MYSAVCFLAGVFLYSLSSSALALSKAADCSSVKTGYCSLRLSIFDTMISDIEACATHFLSEGITYQGAHSVLVSLRTSSYASMYSLHFALSERSVSENFQCLSGSSSLLRRRCFCLFFDTLRKNF